MLRFLDVFLSFLGIVFLFPLILIIALVGLFDTGSPLFIQERVGRNKIPFKLIKFRTMSIDTKSMSTHLIDRNSITKFGAFLRRTKLDEILQLVNVLKGDMSLVGPRPCLFSQYAVVEARDKFDLFTLKPGVTGPSQLSRVDMSRPFEQAEIDRLLITDLNFKTYFKYVLLTVVGKGSGDVVK